MTHNLRWFTDKCIGNGFERQLLLTIPENQSNVVIPCQIKKTTTPQPTVIQSVSLFLADLNEVQEEL